MYRTIAIVLAMVAVSCGGEASAPDDAGPDVDACVPGDFACRGTTALICSAQGEWTPTLAPYCDGTVRE